MAVLGGFGAELGEFLKGVEVKRRPGIEVMQSASDTESAQDNSFTTTTSNETNFNDFIKKMLEIRETLRIAGCADAVSLPNIVVIGSQSSGKSSVLESIVGHDFLPKGQNMVTRRPLELTLVHEKDEPRERVIIDGRNGPYYDFTQVQQVLVELNAAVPEGQWISSDPIRMTIYSSSLPDLTLVDLPGYIQVTNRAQPPILRDKIRQLCDQYIRSENNIILAVSAADVDLANSEALKASRKYDPRGKRAIGVLTKLDLVEADYAAQLIANEDYPLELGYVGVVCSPLVNTERSTIKELLHLGRHENPRLIQERAYFKEHASSYVSVQERTGIPALRRILTASLERSIAANLDSVVRQVRSELDELKYQLKAQYSDRFVSPEAYLSELTMTLRQDLTRISHQFTRSRIERDLRDSFTTRLLQLCDDLVWNSADDDTWKRLKTCLAGLTRSGVGRFSTTLISESIRKDLERVFTQSPLAFHINLTARLSQLAESNLQAKCAEACEQVENSLKPFKSGVEFTAEDWRDAKTKFVRLLEDKCKALATEIDAQKRKIGFKKLKRAAEHLQTNEIAEFESPVLQSAREIVLKTAQLKRYSKRLDEFKQNSRHFANLDSVADYAYRSSWLTRIKDFIWPGSLRPQPSDCVYQISAEDRQLTVFKDPRQAEAPEIYLFLVMNRFLAACVPFLHHELVTEFLLPLPDQLVSAENDGALALSRMTSRELASLIRENPEIAEQLEMQERKRALDFALSRLIQMQSSIKA